MDNTRWSHIKSVTTRQPAVIIPSYDHIDFQRLKRQIAAASYLFSSQEKVTWWNEFITRIQKPARQYRQKWLSSLPKQPSNDQSENERDLSVLPQIQQMINKETEARQVCHKTYF